MYDVTCCLLMFFSDICEDGTQFSATNECEDCLRGFYRKANVEDACEPCPVGFVTLDVRSVFVEQCSERKYHYMLMNLLCGV